MGLWDILSVVESVGSRILSNTAQRYDSEVKKATREYTAKANQRESALNKAAAEGKISEQRLKQEREKLAATRQKIDDLKKQPAYSPRLAGSTESSSEEMSEKAKKTVAAWDREWISIGKLKDADLSGYSHCVGLYRHLIGGQTMYVGRAIELHNGGFRKRLSDYTRDSDSARKHSSGRIIHEHIDEIETRLLIVGDDEEAVEITKRLEGQFIARYHPKWNVMINI